MEGIRGGETLVGLQNLKINKKKDERICGYQKFMRLFSAYLLIC